MPANLTIALATVSVLGLGLLWLASQVSHLIGQLPG